MVRRIAASLAALAFATSCGARDRSSTDAAALQQIVVMPHPVAAARWEIFSTPEDDGVPGPTDYRTLIAVVSPQWPVPHDRIGDAFLVPNASRPWLPDDARALIARAAGDSRLPASAACAPVPVTIRRTGRGPAATACDLTTATLLVVTLSHP